MQTITTGPSSNTAVRWELTGETAIEIGGRASESARVISPAERR